MKKLIGYTESALVTLNIFIIFFLIFEDRLVIPAWLQIAGRMHPLVLHFPIVILILAILLYLYSFTSQEKIPVNYYKNLLLVGCVTASFTVILGLFLSREEGYSGSLVHWHKWFGVGVSMGASAFYYLLCIDSQARVSGILLSGLTLIALALTGHFGASLTHGEDFLLSPIRKEPAVNLISLEEATLYGDIIQPLFKAKCVQCHNESKVKGGLMMVSREGLMKGGKTGALWKQGNVEESLLLRRIHLPLEDKKHMPPSNQTQLTDLEVAFLNSWIKSGANFTAKVVSLPRHDTLRMLANKMLSPRLREEADFDFPEADAQEIARLNTAYRVIYSIAKASPGLCVNVYNASQYQSKLIEDLEPLKKQIVSLNLNKIPVTDQDLAIIGKFENLRKLYLNFTSVDGSGLVALKSLKHLEHLSVSGTRVKPRYLEALSAIKSLKELYVWSTPFSDSEIQQLRATLSHVKIETGFKADEKKIVHLTPPKIEQEKKIFITDWPLIITHPIPGVSIRYTINGSAPDSVNGKLYQPPVVLSSPVNIIKTRAYKEGWYGSDLSSATFYKSSYQPDTVILLTLPDYKYRAEGSSTLIDREAGDIQYGSNEGWLGFHQAADMMVKFEKPERLSSVILNTRSNPYGNVFLPCRIQVWGGMDKNNLHLLSTLNPLQPSGYDDKISGGLQCPFDQQSILFLRILAEPVKGMPSWHAKKGQPGWLFIDELLFN